MADDKCVICDSKNLSELVYCNLCRKNYAHAVCAKNERLLVSYENDTLRAYFCKDCQKNKMDKIKEMLKLAEEKVKVNKREKERENAQNTQSKDGDEEHSSKDLSSKDLSSKEHSSKELSSKEEETSELTEEFNQLNVDDVLTSHQSTLNEKKDSHDTRDEDYYDIELKKRKKEMNIACNELQELSKKGHNLENARARLNKAIASLSEWNKPPTNTSVKFATQQTTQTNADSQKQNNEHEVITPPQNGGLYCAICSQNILMKENSLRCKGCSVLVHTECGFNYGEADLPSISTENNLEVIYHCRRCLNRKSYEKLKHNEAKKKDERESVNRIQDSIVVPINMEALSLSNENDKNRDSQNASMVANMNKTLEEMSNEKLRKEWKILPLVTDEGLSWKHFYEAYQDSKDLFKSYVNAQRIRDAIKCDAVKEKGGENLFHKDTCDNTVEFLNSLYEDTTAHMLEKLKGLLSTKINHSQDYDSVLKYLLKSLNFATLQNSVGNHHSSHNQEWMTRITDKLPFEHKSTWQKLCYEKKKSQSLETFRDLENFLKDTIAYVNMVKRDHMFFSTTVNATDSKNTKPQNARKRNPHNNTQINKQPWEFKCWVCQKDDHLIRDCKVVKQKDGKEIFAIASKFKICTLCGREKYIRGKACTGQKTPSECRKCPGKIHWSTVCPNRTVANSSQNKVNDEKKKTHFNNQSEFHTTQKTIEYPQQQAIDFMSRQMLMPPNQQNLHTNQRINFDDGSEFLANNSRFNYVDGQNLNATSNNPW